MAWFRMDDGVVDDPKVQRLSPLLFRAWVNLMCLAKKNGGPLPPIEDIAYKLRVTEVRASTFITELRNASLVDVRDDGQFEMHDWDEWQFQSDVSTDRVKRFRERQKTVSGNCDETFHETHQNRTEQKQSRTEQKPEGVSQRLPDHAFEWFQSAFESARAPAKYAARKGDFVQLAEVRRTYQTPTRDCPQGWTTAVTHYFASTLSKYTLADLCARYDVFLHGPIDRYGKPIEEKTDERKKSTGQSRDDSTAQASARLLARLAAKSSGSIPGGPVGSDTGGVSGKIIEIPAESPGSGNGSGD